VGPQGNFPRIPVTGDFNGDGRADVAFYNRQSGKWATTYDGNREVKFGELGEIPVPGRYGLYYDRYQGLAGRITVDLDQTCTDKAVYNIRTGTFRLWNCKWQDVLTFSLGGPGWLPAVGDIDGDGLTDQGVFNPFTTEWRFIQSTDFYDLERPFWRFLGPVVPHSFTFGLRGELPMMGDYDGRNWHHEPTLYTSFPDPVGSFRVKYRDRAVFPLGIGAPGDIGLMLDVGGGRGADYAVFHPLLNTFEINTNPAPANFIIPFPGSPVAPQFNPGFGIPDTFFLALLDAFGEDYFQVILASQGLIESQPPPPTETPPAGIGRPVSSRWYGNGQAVPGDYKRSIRSDVVMVRPVKGLNYFFGRSGNNTTFSYYFGFPTDTVLNGDFDGDGRFEPNVVRAVGAGLYWYSRNLDATATQVAFGLAGDTPLHGDFDGDGIYDRAVVRNEGGGLFIYIRPSADAAAVIRTQFGLAGDVVYTGDYNGDLRDDIIVFRPASYHWFVKAVDGQLLENMQWGLPEDEPLPPMDFDGDGRVDFAVVRNQGNTKVGYIRFRDNTFRAITIYGTEKRDLPFVGFFSGTNRAEIAIYRPGEAKKPNVFLLQQFGFAPKTFTWGNGSDKFVTPYGNVIGSDTPYDDGDDADTTGCDELIPIKDGANRGNLWKPIAEGGAPAGRPVMLTDPSYYWGADKIEIVDRLGRKLDDGRVVSVGFGFRSIVRFQRKASEYKRSKPVYVRFTLSSGYAECYLLGDPTKRYD